MRRFLKGLAKALAALTLGLAGLWLIAAMHYHPPFGGATIAAQIAAGALALAGAASVWGTRLRPALYAFLVVMAGAVVWWSQIKPDGSRTFAPELARVISYKIDGDVLSVDNVRNFDWRSETDYTERWETRSYRLSELEGVDVYAIYWMGPAIAHVIVSYGFKGGERLAFSIEVRYGPSDSYSLVTGFFKVNQLLYVAADERDLFAIRHWRKDDPYLLRTRISADGARKLLLAYLDSGAAIAAHPRFYNTATTNCTTEIFRLVRTVSPNADWDWRVLASGYLPICSMRRGR